MSKIGNLSQCFSFVYLNQSMVVSTRIFLGFRCKCFQIIINRQSIYDPSEIFGNYKPSDTNTESSHFLCFNKKLRIALHKGENLLNKETSSTWHIMIIRINYQICRGALFKISKYPEVKKQEERHLFWVFMRDIEQNHN